MAKPYTETQIIADLTAERDNLKAENKRLREIAEAVKLSYSSHNLAKKQRAMEGTLMTVTEDACWLEQNLMELNRRAEAALTKEDKDAKK